MIATYRLQLRPEFTFADAERIVPYLARLGVSHVYLSPITESRRGSTHGYDVIDHNRIREALGGPEGFESLRRTAVEHGLGLVLDWVPNHAGVGPRNVYWQDVLAYGPNSPHAMFFDIDWEPLGEPLRGKVLLPFLGSPYGEALDEGHLGVAYADGRFYATYYESRFALNPASYDAMFAAALPLFERTDEYFDLKDLADAYAGVGRDERDHAEGLRTRLLALAERIDFEAVAAAFPQSDLHALLERQFWRLSSWKTAGYEINYRRFFDINELVALHMQTPEVFWESHRLLGELATKDGVTGVRIDHIDGLFDPQGYLENLKSLGVRHAWAEKILGPGETLPEGWVTSGTSGYEFMNDAMGVLVPRDSEAAILRLYRRFAEGVEPFEDEVRRSKRLVMETSLSGELFRLASELDRLSEADYRTRDFTLEALREALAEIIAAFDRYRTYLPHDPDEAREVVREAIARAVRRNPAFEHSVYGFIEHVLTGEVPEELREAQARFVGRFQQYTAPVAAKGVEDTAFYRYVPLVALNEVGGEPEPFGVEPQAFHARARFRAYRYPLNLLATATHDHKRGEDTRMRIITLAELPDEFAGAVTELEAAFERLRGREPESFPMHGGPSANDRYLFYQLLLALHDEPDRDGLAERLAAYMLKAVREAKLRSSWLSPNEPYERALDAFVRGIVRDDAALASIEPLAGAIARHGFTNALAQLVLKCTTPGVPDFYQGTEGLDLSLVDPDNRRPVDYDARSALLESFGETLSAPDAGRIVSLYEARDAALKMYVTARLLRVKRERPEAASGDYRALEPQGDRADGAVAYARTLDGRALVAWVPRFPVALERAGGYGETTVGLPEELQGRTWREALTGTTASGVGAFRLGDAPLPLAVWLSDDPADA